MGMASEDEEEEEDGRGMKRKMRIGDRDRGIGMRKSEGEEEGEDEKEEKVVEAERDGAPRRAASLVGQTEAGFPPFPSSFLQPLPIDHSPIPNNPITQ
eukprot:3491927-Pyramimonas_sp.AAC.1